MINEIQNEKNSYCAQVRIKKLDYLSSGNINRRTNGIFSTFSRTLAGRGRLNLIQHQRESQNLATFVYQNIVRPIQKEYQSILENQAEFDLWHRLKTFELIETCPITWDGGSRLTVGMCQKMINLHCKDIWALDLIPIEYSKFFHVVIDSITLKHIGYEEISWTKISDYKTYFKYQRIYRELSATLNHSPIEIECQVWNSAI